MSTKPAAAPRHAHARPLFTSLAQTRCALERRLTAQLSSSGNREDRLTAAMQYSVLAGGKRLRPMLFLSIARDLGQDTPALFDLAGAIEMAHAASLILDDLPCMDDAKLRRGQVAVHIRYGEDLAVLAAVSLLSLAFQMLASAEGIAADAALRCTSALAQAVGAQGLAKGQYQDLHQGQQTTATDVASTYALKTGALLGAVIEMAATAAHASAETTQSLRQFAAAAGQAFQIRDDLLDIGAGPAAAQGDGVTKDTGQDGGKATVPSILGTGAAQLRMDSKARQAFLHLETALGPHNQTRQLIAPLFPRCDVRDVLSSVNN